MIKNLPKDEAGIVTNFTANGKKYTVLKPGNPIGIKRWSMYEKLRFSLGVGRTFKDLAEVLETVELTIAADGDFATQRRDAILLLNSLRKAVIETSEERYNIAFYICTLFMVREGENLADWDEMEADDKISDWQKEGYSEQDFFFFALLGVEGFKAVFKKQQKKVRELEAELLGFSKYGTATTTK